MLKRSKNRCATIVQDDDLDVLFTVWSRRQRGDVVTERQIAKDNSNRNLEAELESEG